MSTIDGSPEPDKALVDCALQYAGRGWPVFRLTGKYPFKGSHGHLDATTDAATIANWWGEKPRANIGLACGDLVVVDCDGPDAWRRLKEAAAAHGGIPDTLMSQTTRADGGLHLYFKPPSGTEIRTRNEARAKKGDSGIDVKGAGGYVLLPPSKSRSGRVYKWIRDVPAIELPDWLYKWLQTLGVTKVTDAEKLGDPFNFGPIPDYIHNNSRLGEHSVSESLENSLSLEWNEENEERILNALDYIGVEVSYDEWIFIGMALCSLEWQRSDGTDWGHDTWQWFSEADSARYAAAKLDTHWQSFGKRTTGPKKGIGYIFWLAGSRGWNERPEVVPPEMPPAPEPPPSEEKNGHELPPHMTATPESNNPLIRLNDNYAVIGDMGGKCLVMSWVKSKVDDSVKIPSFQTFKSFGERFSHRYIKVADEPKQLGTFWLKWPHRTSYEGIDLVPGGAPVLNGVLNLWKGFAVEPVQGEWGLMRQHIIDVLAGGDAKAAAYILKFAAWAVQHPGERAEVALVFRGGKGSGKGTFANAMRRLFGTHGLQIFNPKHLTGAFNGHLRNCILLFADEAFWAGDKQGESVLKGMLTESVLMIEQKGIDASLWKNRLHVIMAANAEWVVPASHDERRFAMFDVSDAKIGEEGYFKALHQEMHAGGLGAMLYDLQRARLEDWHPRHIVHTAALQSQKERSLHNDPRFEWWEGILQNGRLPNLDKDDKASATTLFENARSSIPLMGRVSSTSFGRFLRERGCVWSHAVTGSVWKVPKLDVCRADWERKFGKWQWREKTTMWNEPAKTAETAMQPVNVSNLSAQNGF